MGRGLRTRSGMVCGSTSRSAGRRDEGATWIRALLHVVGRRRTRTRAFRGSPESKARTRAPGSYFLSTRSGARECRWLPGRAGCRRRCGPSRPSYTPSDEAVTWCRSTSTQHLREVRAGGSRSTLTRSCVERSPGFRPTSASSGRFRAARLARRCKGAASAALGQPSSAWRLAASSCPPAFRLRLDLGARQSEPA